jgi:DNA polymerase-1
MAASLFPPGSDDVLYIVDVSSYVLRAYHAILPLSSPSGEPTHAVHGTLSMVERLLRERQPRLFAVAMDSGRATFRRDIYPDYKANRPPAPDDLKSQLERCEAILRAFAIPVLKQPGVEADDLIATLVKWAGEHELKVVIVGADKDLMQLVSERVVLWDTMRDKVFGPAEVEERFGVPPERLRDVLALMGDSSDNVPGVPSVGPKTASELIRAYSNLENLYQRLDDVPKKKLKETLAQYREQAFVSQRLVTLKEDCPLELDVEALRMGTRDTETLRCIYTELGLVRHLAWLDKLEHTERAAGAEARGAPAAVKRGVVPAFSVVTTREELHELTLAAKRLGRLALSVQTHEAGDRRHDVIGLGLAVEAGRAAYVPVSHRYVGAPAQLELDIVRAELEAVLGDEGVKKLGHDLKRSRTRLASFRLPLRGLAFDAHLASYLVDPEGDHELAALAARELGLELRSPLAGVKGRAQTGFDSVAVEATGLWCAGRAHACLELEPLMVERLEAAALDRIYREVELPLAPVLSDLELRGVLIDTKVLAEIGKQCEEDLARLERRAHEVAARPFNVHSPRQLEGILFDDLGLKPLKRTKTSRSTDAATLETLTDQHELPKIILEIRQIAKLKGTYIDALPALVDATTGRVHTSWEQAVAATGRISSTDPNLQNIPIRSELGRRIRGAFVAPPGRQLVSADYSQIELRVLAHLSQDPVLLDAFRSGQDIHTRTAMEIFDVEASGVTREMRTRSKAVNFGVIYGQGDSGLAKALGISRVEAGNFIAAYFRRYAGVQRFMEKTLDESRSSESVRSLLGRHRLLPDIKSGNRSRRLAAERVAMNMPIQGTAADLLKLSMLALAEPVTPGTRMVLTVHDELVFEVPDGEVESAEAKSLEKMQNVYPLDVPLVVDVGHGRDWMSAH